MLLAGKGVEKNVNDAKRWLQKAIEGGSREAFDIAVEMNFVDVVRKAAENQKKNFKVEEHSANEK